MMSILYLHSIVERKPKKRSKSTSPFEYLSLSQKSRQIKARQKSLLYFWRVLFWREFYSFMQTDPVGSKNNNLIIEGVQTKKFYFWFALIFWKSRKIPILLSNIFLLCDPDHFAYLFSTKKLKVFWGYRIQDLISCGCIPTKYSISSPTYLSNKNVKKRILYRNSIVGRQPKSVLSVYHYLLFDRQCQLRS